MLGHWRLQLVALAPNMALVEDNCPFGHGVGAPAMSGTSQNRWYSQPKTTRGCPPPPPIWQRLAHAAVN